MSITLSSAAIQRSYCHDGAHTAADQVRNVLPLAIILPGLKVLGFILVDVHNILHWFDGHNAPLDTTIMMPMRDTDVIGDTAIVRILCDAYGFLQRLLQWLR